MVSPAFPGMFFCFAALALLVFASVSPPAWDQVNFLDAHANGVRTVFGMLGECATGSSGRSCTGPGVGYSLTLGGATNVDIGSVVLNRLTKALILHVISGGLAFIAFLFGLMGIICASRFMTIMMTMTAGLGALASIVIFVIDMVLWCLVRNRIRDAGFEAELGNCNWFTVGATVALFLAFCTSACGACGRFASGRMAGEKY